MAICDSPDDDRAHICAASAPEGVILVDRFLEDALEFDVDALCDGDDVLDRRGHGARRGRRHPLGRLGVRAAAPAGRPGGDRRARGADRRDCDCARRRRADQRPVRPRRRRALCHRGQPRASRTIPFVAKATGVPLVRHALRVMLGESIADLDLPSSPRPERHVAVKEAVLAVLAVHRVGPPARTGDACDRRGHGPRADLRRRVCQGAARRGGPAAEIRHGLRVDPRRRQGARGRAWRRDLSAPGSASAQPGARRQAWPPPASRSTRSARSPRARRQHHRRDPGGRDRHGDQHAQRRRRPAPTAPRSDTPRSGPESPASRRSRPPRRPQPPSEPTTSSPSHFRSISMTVGAPVPSWCVQVVPKTAHLG